MMWNLTKSLVQIVLTLLGLSGLVDNVVEWQGFIGNIVPEYQRARDFVFGILPFELPNYLKDYIVIGLPIAAGFLRAVSLKIENDDKFYRFGVALFSLVYIPVVAIFWPILLLVVSLAFVGNHFGKKWYGGDVDNGFVEDSTITLATAFIAYVAFLGILFVSSDALSKLSGG